MNNKKLIDFYELTMAYTDFKNKREERLYFDAYFRKNLNKGGYNIMSGLDDIIECIKNFKFDKEDINYLRSLNNFDEEFLEYLENFKFKGDIYAIPDGTPVFATTPCITVVGDAIETKIIETDILARFNHGCMIATKAKRITNEAKNRGVLEFGARRAHGETAAINGAKHAYIGGCLGTSCYEAGKQYQIPLFGTMAHSHIQGYANEYEAFMAYAKVYPNNAIFLVDTIDTLKSGVVNAIKVAQEYLIPNGYRLKGIRLDSGDLAYLSKEARKMLDEAGLYDATICVSNSLDEFIIRDLLSQGAPIDSFGVGENLITSKTDPVFGGVYKLVAVEKEGNIIPKIKISENVGKITNPGYKKVYRFYDKDSGYAIGDVIALANEQIKTDTYTLINPNENWKRKDITNYVVTELQQPIFKNGELVYQVPTVAQSKEHANNEFKKIYPEVARINNPHEYPVDLSEELLKLKHALLEGHKQEVEKVKILK